MNANWQMIAMLNILVSILGACLMYHTEYAEKGWEKMSSLPIHTGRLFLGKCIIAAMGLAALLFLEFCSVTACLIHWFPQTPILAKELLCFAGFQFIITLPTVILMLVIASACESMWISLGIGVILLFTFSNFSSGKPCTEPAAFFFSISAFFPWRRNRDGLHCLSWYVLVKQFFFFWENGVIKKSGGLFHELFFIPYHGTKKIETF